LIFINVKGLPLPDDPFYFRDKGYEKGYAYPYPSGNAYRSGYCSLSVVLLFPVSLASQVFPIGEEGRVFSLTPLAGYPVAPPALVSGQVG
jgi:hypothetical protein